MATTSNTAKLATLTTLGVLSWGFRWFWGLSALKTATAWGLAVAKWQKGPVCQSTYKKTKPPQKKFVNVYINSHFNHFTTALAVGGFPPKEYAK